MAHCTITTSCVAFVAGQHIIIDFSSIGEVYIWDTKACHYYCGVYQIEVLLYLVKLIINRNELLLYSKRENYYGDQSIDSDFCTVYVATSIDEQFKRELPIFCETIALDATRVCV